MPVERIVTLTTSSGQTIPVEHQRAPGRSFGEQFVVVFTRSAQEIAKTIEHASTLRVFLALPAELDFETYKPLNQPRLARELRINQGSVSRAMKELLGRGIIERQGAGPSTLWRLSLNWGWRGNVESYHAARMRRNKTAAPASSIAAEGILC